MTVPVMDDLLNRLTAGDQAAFERLADALTSSQDQDARKQAEELYNQLVEKHPDLAVRYLVAGLGQGEDMRRFCCLYLRKVRRFDALIGQLVAVCQLWAFQTSLVLWHVSPQRLQQAEQMAPEGRHCRSPYMHCVVLLASLEGDTYVCKLTETPVRS